MPLLRVAHLHTHYRSAMGTVHAVNDVSFDLPAGRTLGIVGESGSGKSTLARTLLRLTPATSGEVYFDGRPVLTLDRRQMRRLRRQMQIVFQDPATSLNPRLRIATIVGEALRVHGLVRNRAAARRRVGELLQQVGLQARDLDRYPHEFSGGQRQRIGIARALAVEPRLIICDEPVSALDVSIQAQVLNLLVDLQQQYGLSYLFIAHDLAVVRHLSDEVAVMRNGSIVEHQPTGRLFDAPQHPYTRELLAAAPQMPQPYASA